MQIEHSKLSDAEAVAAQKVYWSSGLERLQRLARGARPAPAVVLFDFFFAVREAGVPVSVKEFLTLLEALDKGVVYGSVDDFYTLARARAW